MEKKQIIWIVVAVVIVLVGGALYIFLPHPPSANTPAPGTGTTNTDGTTQVTQTRTTPPADVVVPSKGDQNVPADVAVPTVEAPASQSGNSTYRSFNINAANDKFMPSNINVNIGDTVDIELTAVDKNYDFTLPDYGFNVPVVKGATKQIQFGATATGKFTFYCTSCGGPSAGPVGYVVVAPK